MLPCADTQAAVGGYPSCWADIQAAGRISRLLGTYTSCHGRISRCHGRISRLLDGYPGCWADIQADLSFAGCSSYFVRFIKMILSSCEKLNN